MEKVETQLSRVGGDTRWKVENRQFAVIVGRAWVRYRATPWPLHRARDPSAPVIGRVWAGDRVSFDHVPEGNLS